MPVQHMMREIGRFRAESWGMYRYALSRVDAQAESIACLKGAATEHKHIRETYAVHRFDVTSPTQLVSQQQLVSPEQLVSPRQLVSAGHNCACDSF